MSLILIIDTSTQNCSVALSKNGNLIDSMDFNDDTYSHYEKLPLLIKNIFLKNKFNIKKLEAVAVGKGPGSFTGLRIGISSAKGICYGLKIPLISFNSLEILTRTFLNNFCIEDNAALIPVIDARRMEVYSCIYDINLNMKEYTSAKIIDKKTFSRTLTKSPCHFIGNGSVKIQKIINNENASFYHKIYPLASSLSMISYEYLKQKKFENIAYFEPFYLKNFVNKNLNKLII